MVIEQDSLRSVFLVVVNDEEQYSVWPQNTALPVGWKTVGMQGSKEHCLAEIKTLWTDMRPLSLRDQMDSARARIPSKNNTQH